MKISDYVSKKYLKGAERDSFFKRWKGYDTETTPVELFRELRAYSNHSGISGGIEMLGELGIREQELEHDVLEYCSELIADSSPEGANRENVDLVETIFWALGEIGSVDSLEFLQELIFNGGEWFGSIVDPEHALSACQYSFYSIIKREMAEFFNKTRSIREVPLKSQVEIDAIRKLNPKYAEFQQFLLDNYNEYDGGLLN